MNASLSRVRIVASPRSKNLKKRLFCCLFENGPSLSKSPWHTGHVTSRSSWSCSSTSVRRVRMCRVISSILKLGRSALSMDFPTETVQVGKFTVSVIDNDQYIAGCLRRGHEWDGWMRQDLPYVYRPGTDILDIGGNIGWNALMFSDYGPVQTFEPLFHKVITKNVSQNLLQNSVTVHPFGLSSQFCPEIKMFTPRKDHGLVNYGGASLDPDPRWYDAEGGYPVRLEKLDDVYHGTPSVIKLDVERHELEVLKGAWRTITTHRPSMYIEILDPSNDEIVNLLKPLGYEMIPRPENNYLFTCLSSPS